MNRDHMVRIILAATRHIALGAWSGSVAAAWLYDALPEDLRLVRVSPLYEVRPGGEHRAILSGARGRGVVLEPGTLLALEAVVRGDATMLLAWLPSTLAQRGLDVLELTVEPVPVEPPRPPETGEPTILLEISYLPTIHTFRGRRVLYPSPARLLSSAARTLGEITRSNLRSAVPQLLQGFEMLGHKTRITEFSIGRGRTVKAFHGTALYAIDKRIAHDVLRLIHTARVYGAGKSRGIGFGTLQYRTTSKEH